jgi:hypothetical protein
VQLPLAMQLLGIVLIFIRNEAAFSKPSVSYPSITTA